MGFIAISERTHFDLGKVIFIFPKTFLHILGEQGKFWKNLVWNLTLVLLGPRALQKKILNEFKSYLL